MLAYLLKDQYVVYYKFRKVFKAAMSSIRKLVAMKSDQNEENEAERRIGIERRKFSYSAYIPERRSGRKRRREAETTNTPDDLSTSDLGN